MEKTASAVRCVITSDSPEQLRAAETLLRRRLAPDTVLVDTKLAYPNGVETQITRSYKVSDYFEDVKVLSDNDPTARSIQVVFHPREGADPFWKDVMANTLRFVQASASGVTVRSVKRVS
jgi:hypothetical protein